MPDDNQNGNHGAGGDNENGGGENQDQNQNQNNNGGGNGGDDDVVTLKKDELEKLKKDSSDLGNYRTAALSNKEDAEKWRDHQKQSQQDQGQGGNEQKNNQGNNDRSFFDDIEKANEKDARAEFARKYPEYADTTIFGDLLADFVSRRGKKRTKDIVDDLEDAVLLHKRRTGKLDEHLSRMKEEGKREGANEAALDLGRNAGGRGDGSGGGSGGSKLTPEAEEMARRMGNDPSKIAALDPKKDNVISIKPKR